MFFLVKNGFSPVATVSEIKEDFRYLGIVELAILIAVSANSIYSGDTFSPFLYFLIFLAVILAERHMMVALLIPKHNIKERFEFITKEKKSAKRAIVFLLSFLILLSSWGIIAYMAKLSMETREYTKILTLMIPWYIAIYGVWFGYLLYLKGKYTKFVLSLLSQKKRKDEKTVFLFHRDIYLTHLPTHHLDEKLKKEISIHNEDFHYGTINVAVEREGDLKMALLAHDIDARSRAAMRAALRAIKISFPKKFESGNYNEGEIREMENIIRRYLFA